MPRADNPVIGHYTCDICGSETTVHVRKGKAAGYLYTRCPKCGCDQRNGQPRQTRLFYESEWLDAAPDRPPNVPEKAPEAVQILEEKPVKPEETEKTGGAGWWLAVIPVALFAIIGLRK